MLAAIPTRHQSIPNLNLREWHCWGCAVSGHMPRRECWCCGSTDPEVVMEAAKVEPKAPDPVPFVRVWDPEPFGHEAGPPTDYPFPPPLRASERQAS